MRSGSIVLPTVILCVVVSSARLTAQTSDPGSGGPESATDESENPQHPTDDRPYWRTNLFGRFFRDQKYLVTTWWPQEFRRPAFMASALAGVALAADSETSLDGGIDRQFEQSVLGASSGDANRPWRRLSSLGNAPTGALLIGVGYLVGRLSHQDRLAEASSLSAEALLSSGLYCTVLKALSARTRPASGGRGDFFEYQPQSGQVNGSFPSGHATGAFTVATVFAGVYSDRRWVPWIAYGTAGLVGASRVALGRHFPSDVLMGAVLGHSVGRMVVQRQRDAEDTAFRIEPYIDFGGQSAGVVWSRRW